MDAGLIEQVNALKHLPEADKEILRDALQDDFAAAEKRLPELSIFRKRDVKTFDHYVYSETKDTLYYIGEHNRLSQGVFFDENGKLEYNSRYFLTHFGQFIQMIDMTLANIARFDLSKATDIGGNFVAIEKWFITYGHFQDEIFSLGDFMTRRDLFGKAKALIDYPTDDYLNTQHFQATGNYQILDRLIFGDDSVNVYDSGDGVVKLTGLTLIDNRIQSDTFHRFPSAVSQRIRQSVTSSDAEPGPEKIFITRSSSYRDIGNKDEVEGLFEAAGYVIVNPEKVSITELIRLLRSVKSVAMYFGSAMTNMIYMPSGTRVFILKSKSYAHETLDIWQKAIKEYALNLTILPASDDNIVLPDTLAQAQLSAG